MSVADSLRANSPRDAHIVRMGGDEFFVWLPGGNEETALALARQVDQEMAMSLIPGRSHRTVRASFGVALARGDEDLDQLILRADRAMYRAKATADHEVICDICVG